MLNAERAVKKTLSKATRDALATIQRILGHMQGSRPDYVQPGWLRKVEDDGLIFDGSNRKASCDFVHQKVRNYNLITIYVSDKAENYSIKF